MAIKGRVMGAINNNVACGGIKEIVPLFCRENTEDLFIPQGDLSMVEVLLVSLGKVE